MNALDADAVRERWRVELARTTKAKVCVDCRALFTGHSSRCGDCRRARKAAQLRRWKRAHPDRVRAYDSDRPARRAYLARKKRERRERDRLALNPRFCPAPECGRELPEDAPVRQRHCDRTCAQRAWRARTAA